MARNHGDGSCGENATWTLDGDTLTISGTGATADWKDHGSADDGMHCGAEAHDGDTTCEKANCMLNRPWQSYIDSITKIVIEEGITAIGSDSFNGLTAVTEIELPDSLTEIGIGAFCFTAITEVTIPANVSTMGYSAFYGCGKLESVFFAGNKVREIGIYTFAKCYALKNLEFPEGLTAIRLGALQECRSLEELVFPESLTVLEQSVLGDSSGKGTPNTTLKKVVVKSDVAIPGFMFCRCTALETVDLSDKVTEIGEKAFWECTDLKTVDGFDAVSTIGREAFQGCSSLENIQFGTQLTTIGQFAFDKTGLTEVFVPASVTRIDQYGFANNVNLKKIVFEGTVAPTIGGNTITNNPLLAAVVLTNMSDFSNLTSDSFVYWSTDTKQFTVFYVKDSDALTALKDKRTSGHPCAYAAAGEGAEVLNCEKGKLATVSKIDGIFDGWYEKADYSGNKVTDAANNQSYYANWVECKHDNTKAYTASGNVITETCHDCGHVFGTATLTLPENLVYDGQAKAIDVTYSDSWKSDKLSVTYVQNGTEVEPVNAGTYNLKITVGGAEVSTTMTLTIDKAAFTVATEAYDGTYDGQPHSVTVTAEGATVTYSEDGKNYSETNPAYTDAGEYTVYYKATKDNYNDVTGDLTVKIAQATPTITISADKETLTGGGDVVLTVITEPEEGTVDVSCDKDVDITLNKENGTFTATLPNSSEKYTFTATYVESTNYKTASDTCDVTVTYQSTSSGGGGGSRNNSYAVSTPKADNGSVTVNNGTTAKKGDIVTITVKPDAGYKIDKITVTDSKGNQITVTDKGNGKFSFTMPDSKVDVKATFVKSEVKPDQPSKTTFVDVPENSWYADAADFVAQRGLMSGIGENLFGGSQNTTRAMLMTILARMDGQDVTGGATWYEKAMNWAKANGVSDGTMPEVNITREQLATMLYSYAKLKGIDTTQGGMAVREFSDYDSISDWAGQSMTWAVNAGILSGRGNNTLAPTAGATRAEMAVMLQQFVKLMEK